MPPRTRRLDPPASKRLLAGHGLRGNGRPHRQDAPATRDGADPRRGQEGPHQAPAPVDEDQHPKSDITVRQAIEQWLAVVELEQTTRERYDDLIRLYILPTFGTLPAAKLDAELLERFYARLHRCRDLCNGKPRAGHTCRPLSTSTTRKIHYIIRGALDRAVRWRHLGVNRAAMAIAPAPRRTEPDPPNADEAARLLNAAWSDPEWGLLLWLTMLTGPRRGEISALRWRHIDFDCGQLWIERSNAQPKAGVTEKATKTGQRRKIALDEHTSASSRRIADSGNSGASSSAFRKFDVVLDIGGVSPIARLRRALTRTGSLAIVGGENGATWSPGMGRQLHAILLNPFVSQRLTMVANKEHFSGLERLAAHALNGTVASFTDRLFNLSSPQKRSATSWQARPEARSSSPSEHPDAVAAGRSQVQATTMTPAPAGSGTSSSMPATSCRNRWSSARC